jgi:hypothetical protein
MENNKVTESSYVDYPITVGIRIRLNAEQKELIKKHYDEIANCAPKVSEARGGLKVVTQANPATDIVHQMGCNRIVLSSLLGSSERHPIGTLRRWEKVLGLEGKLVQKKPLDDAYKSLLKHLDI